LLAMLQSIALRPALPDDEAFLLEVYTSNRGDDLAALDWPNDRIRDFLATQYAAQQLFFKTDYPQANELIILRESDRIGRIIVERGEHELRIVDIALLPPHCNAGVGTYVIKELLAEAGRLRRVLRLQVMRSNPAVGLFERLGLVRTGETGSHYQMEWRAP
jgi:ribosomal protein S18 acetylase RimI-like enzyme